MSGKRSETLHRRSNRRAEHPAGSSTSAYSVLWSRQCGGTFSIAGRSALSGSTAGCGVWPAVSQAGKPERGPRHPWWPIGAGHLIARVIAGNTVSSSSWWAIWALAWSS